MTANIGEADVEVHGDIKPFEKDLEKIRALVEKMDDLSVRVHAKLAPRQRTSLQRQLNELKPPFTIKVFAQLAGGQRKALQDSLTAFKTNPNIRVDPKLVVGSKAKIQAQLDAITGLNVITQLDLDKAALATETQRQRLLAAQNAERRSAIQLEAATEAAAKRVVNETVKATRLQLAHSEKILKIEAEAVRSKKEILRLDEERQHIEANFVITQLNNLRESKRVEQELLALERERGNNMLGLIKRLTDAGIREEVMTRNMTSFSGVLKSAVGQATQLSRIKFDNLNQLLGSAVAGDTLLRKMGEIFNNALKIRKVAVQMGTALASGFALGAQAVGALVSGMASAVKLGAALAGIGVIAIAVKFLLDDAEVKASLDNLKSTFRSVITDSAQNLKPLLRDFFDELSEGLNSQRPAFESFFKTVEPGFRKLTQAINDFVKSEDFARILGKFGTAANDMLTKVGEGLRGFILGTEKVFDKLVAVQERLRDALGPGIFEGISAEGIVAGIVRLVTAIESAGAGIRAFKENFGTTMDAVKLALEGVLDTIGTVGPALFNALGPIAAQVATTLGSVAESFIRLSSEVLPNVKDSVIEFISVFGDNFAKSIELLAEPLSQVINGITSLGTQLAPLLPMFSELLVNLDPVATAFLGMLESLTPLALAMGEFAVQLSQGIGPVLATTVTVFETIGTIISTVVTPAITLLNSSGLVPLLGGLAAIAGVLTAAGVGFAVLAAKTRITRAAFAEARAENALLGGGLQGLRNSLAQTDGALANVSTRMRIMAGVATAASSQVEAGGRRINAALGLISAKMPATSAVVANGFRRMSAESLKTAAQMASANARAAASITSLAVANGRAATSSRIVTATFRVQAAALTVAAGASRVASVAVRGLGAAFRFLLGPIGLILIGVELLIAGFKGFMRMLGGVIEILKAVGKALVFDFDGAKESFSKGMDDIVGGAKDAAGQIKDHFTGSGEDAMAGFGDGALSGADGAAEKVKQGLAKINIVASQAGTEGAQAYTTQLAQGISNLELGEKVQAFEGLKAAAAKGALQFVDTFVTEANRQPIANFLSESGFSEGLIEQFRNTGLLSKEAFIGEIDSMVVRLRQQLGENAIDATTALQVAQALKSVGAEGATELVNSLESTIGVAGPKVTKAVEDTIPKSVPAAKAAGKNAASDVITSLTSLLEKSSGQIGGAIDKAFNTALPSVATNLAPRLNSMLSLAFSLAIGLSSELPVVIMSGFNAAFTTATTMFTPLLGVMVSNMMTTAFTTMQTSGLVLATTVQNILTGAFTFALLNMSSLVGQQINQMLITAFSTMQTSGLVIAASIQNVLEGAFNFALINLPSAIGQGLSNALTVGVQLGLNGFGLTIQGSINEAFIVGFSGVGGAILAPLSSAFLGVMGAVNDFSKTVTATMKEAVSDIEDAFEPLKKSLPETIREAMQAAVEAAVAGAKALVQAIRNAKSEIEGIDFYSPGYQIGARLAAGIRAATAAEVIPAANAMAAAVRDRTPSSPAKKGPLSGAGDPLVTGAKIVKRLVSGIQAENPQLVKTMDHLLATIHRSQANVKLGGNLQFPKGGLRGRSSTPIGGDLMGSFDPTFKGSILNQDTNARMSSAQPSNRLLQIRPNNINVNLQGVNDPREFINSLSNELMTNFAAR